MRAIETNLQILIVDRDIAEVEPLRQRLSEARFRVRAITDGVAAVTVVAVRPPQLVIVDWNMPGSAALEIINQSRGFRTARRVRVIILSTGGEQDVVAALDFGADDFIAKPFSEREAVSRVCAVLRCRPTETVRSTLSFGGLKLETGANRVVVGGKLINIRGIEYRLLEFLMAHPGQTFNREQLLAQVWGDAAVDERTVDVSVQRLRKHLGNSGCKAYVQTIRGFGYRFAPPSTLERDADAQISTLL